MVNKDMMYLIGSWMVWCTFFKRC